MPYHCEASNPGRPASATVGTSGAADGAGPSKENLVAARKARLEELFQELLVEYDQVLEKL
jgi:hypothetical protein